MSDMDQEFEKELEAAFEIEDKSTPAAAPKVEEPATPPAATPKVEEPKKDDPAVPADQDKKDEESEITIADPANPEKKDPANPEAPETPAAVETPAAATPLTEEGVRKLLQEARTEERNSGVELQNATQTVMEAYYPDGLSNVLTTPDGKELKTPQDVVDASNGEMSTEQAAQWLMNQQYELDQNIANIKKQAENIAETTVAFKRDAMLALQKYEPLFKQYPQLQSKTYDLMMKQVKIDQDKGVILQAPDVLDLYDTYLEPYQRAYEFSTQQPATNPIATPAAPVPAKPGQADRMDEGGDGGSTTEVDDPNDFAQQVAKELAKGA